MHTPRYKFPVYSIGVDFVTPNGNIATKCPSGYNYNMHVIDLIMEGAKAFKDAKGHAPDPKYGSYECVYNSMGVNYIFVTRDGSIVTFYSDLTPHAEMCSMVH